MRVGRTGVRYLHRTRPEEDSTDHLSSGTSFVDELLGGGLRPGDNVLLLAERGTPVLSLMRSFVDVEHAHAVVVDVTGTWHDLDRPNVTVLDWRHLHDTDPSPPARETTSRPRDPEALTRQLVETEEQVGPGAYWLFDSFTAMQQGIGAEDALAVFLVACPRLYRRNSVALMPVDTDMHDRSFLDRLRSTVQVVLELRPTTEGAQLEITKADGRPAGTVSRRVTFRIENDEFDVGTTSSGIKRLGQQLRTERQQRGMTQADLGRLVGVSASAISQFERGVSGISGHVLTRLWQALEVPFGPSDHRRRGYRIVRRGETHRNDIAPGVSAALLFNDPQVGRGWDLTIAPHTSRPKGMFAVEATEVILVEQGVFDLVIAGKEHTLTEGDNLITTNEAITSWRNPAHHPTKLFWFVLESFGPPHSGTE